MEPIAGCTATWAWVEMKTSRNKRDANILILTKEFDGIEIEWIEPDRLVIVFDGILIVLWSIQKDR